MRFDDRKEAGQLLGTALKKKPLINPIVFGLARGGVIVAKEVAKTLGAPLEVLVVKKLSSPKNPEYGFGAVAPEGTEYIDWERAEEIGLSLDEISEIIRKESLLLKKRLQKYRGDKAYWTLMNRTVILVDDGMATGVSMKAAIAFSVLKKADNIIIATPVTSESLKHEISPEVSLFVSLITTDNFLAVGQFYENFDEVTDEDVIGVLKQFK